ncbi:hypothetical protein [Sphingomonas sp. VDB2]|uniref:hypothetical protein n=1 Tax=Sphingomonas sp. VDB2 TaxID=3228751 RepID=UPI003A809F04
MAVTVDDLRAALDAATDMQLAEMLGVERSTVAQWRKRGVPRRFQSSVKIGPEEEAYAKDFALRRRLFGDGDGGYLMMAAMAHVPLSCFDMPAELSNANIGGMRMDMVLIVARYIVDLLGDRRSYTEGDYLALMQELDGEQHRRAIARAIGPFQPI